MTSTPDPAADHVLVHYADIELDNGENLRDLNVGDHLELSEPTAGMRPGTWQVVAWRGDPAFPDEAVMRPVSAAEALAALSAPAPSKETV
jgi:hypothetical protein